MSTSGFSQGDSKKSGEPLRARAAVRRSRRRRGDGAKIKTFWPASGQTDCFARGRLMQTKTSASRSGAIDLEKSPAEVLTLPFDGEGKPEPASKSKNKKAVAGFKVG
jgi:hypothetical protein